MVDIVSGLSCLLALNGGSKTSSPPNTASSLEKTNRLPTAGDSALWKDNGSYVGFPRSLPLD